MVEHGPQLPSPERQDGFLESDGVRLKYSLVSPDTRQPQPGILLVHGSATAGGRGRVNFETLQNQLAIAGFASFAVDNRGVGESEGEYQDATLEQRIRDTKYSFNFLLKGNTIDTSRLAILGLSMGGHVVARTVGAAPARFKGLILVNGAAYGVDAENKKLKPSTEFTEAIRRERGWEGSEVFNDIRKFEGRVLMIDSAIDDVIDSEIKRAYRQSIRDLTGSIILPAQQHAFATATDEASVRSREIMNQSVVDFLRIVLK